MINEFVKDIDQSIKFDLNHLKNFPVKINVYEKKVLNVITGNIIEFHLPYEPLIKDFKFRFKNDSTKLIKFNDNDTEGVQIDLKENEIEKIQSEVNDTYNFIDKETLKKYKKNFWVLKVFVDIFENESPYKKLNQKKWIELNCDDRKFKCNQKDITIMINGLKFKKKFFQKPYYKSNYLNYISEDRYAGFICGEQNDIEIKKRVNKNYLKDDFNPLNSINSVFQPNKNPFYQKISKIDLMFEPLIIEVQYLNKYDEIMGPFEIQICPS